jgi:NADH:ubiquinone oxidoreductase subunit E
VEAGATSEDGFATLRPVECMGGCGWATIVAVDHDYRRSVTPEQVPAIVEELRRAD